MKNNQEILNFFGKILIRTIFDPNSKFIKQSVNEFANTEEYKNLFQGMSLIQKKELENLVYEINEGTLFDFLKFFEENEQFKIVYEEEGKQVNLVEISEMLKAEIHGENGWIERFSEELKKDNDS
ncbi:hypothetical protein [Cellulophaga omnivescoria]|uniref:hypothetical protein n=1 Tax=Cellulophaga omnivescoria TaxID=1888890 RepID=UPI0009843F3E|nr:hypothetical protein [Cellulophaga omnivescoria]